MTARLIVNADDYGHTPGVSAGIREAHLKGIVTSTSAMMNKPAVVEALAAAKACPRLGIGVHLVLTSGSPVLSMDKVQSLVTAEGKFFNESGFVGRLPGVSYDEVWAEWNAQVEKFISLTGRSPDHLDSHHHSSYFNPQLYEMMLKLAAQLDCPIRRPRWQSCAETPCDLEEPFTKESIERMRALNVKYVPRTTDIFIDSFYDTHATRAHLFSILAAISGAKGGTTAEIMCHPAIVDELLLDTSSYNVMRARERVLLEDAEVIGYIRDHAVQLINYSQL